MVVAIDIGTSKICVLCGQANKSGQADVVASSVVPCFGARKGMITDIEAVAGAISEGVRQCEAAAGVRISSAYVNVMGAHVDVITNRRDISTTGDNRQVSRRDVDRLIRLASDVYVPPDSQIIDVIPRQYLIDGYGGVVAPVGMNGSELTIEADVVTGKVVSVSNIIRCVKNAGLEIDGLVISGQAQSEISLTTEERNMGAVIIDVGGTITDVSVFRGGRLCFYESAPVGGDTITGDISYVMRVTLAEAEKIKKNFKLALASLISMDQELLINDINENERKRVYISEIVEVIEARVYEIIEMCKYMLDIGGVSLDFGAGVVLTGGGIAYFDGVRQIANDVFGLPVRTFPPRANVNQRLEALLAEGIVKHVVRSRSGTKFASDVQSLKTPGQGAGGIAHKAIELLRRIF